MLEPRDYYGIIERERKMFILAAASILTVMLLHPARWNNSSFYSHIHAPPSCANLDGENILVVACEDGGGKKVFN
jgi:hypothetical protein